MCGGSSSGTCGQTDMTNMLEVFGDYAKAPYDFRQFTAVKIVLDASRYTR